MQDLAALVSDLHAKLTQKSRECVQQRRPLVRKPASRADVKQYSPQFEEEHVPGKDYDPDRHAPADSSTSLRHFTLPHCVADAFQMLS